MNYVVFDLEATCGKEIPNGESEIIEIGAVMYNDRLEKIGEFQSFIRPVIHPTITYFCQELTTITQADVDNANTFDTVVMDFWRWCSDCTEDDWFNPTEFCLCSWGFYDKGMLKQDLARWRLPSDLVDNHISIKHQHGAMIGNKRGVGMATALKMLNIPLEGTHHRAISDAKNIGKIFVEIFPQLKF
jgi:inhibitor of KinA sporulation pathway (predicted exonuclease)